MLLKLNDGSLYRPQSVELYTQKDKEFFEYAGDKYAPLSKTNLRFSDLTAHPKLIITYDDVISFISSSQGLAKNITSRHIVNHSMTISL